MTDDDRPTPTSFQTPSSKREELRRIFEDAKKRAASSNPAPPDTEPANPSDASSSPGTTTNRKKT